MTEKYGGIQEIFNPEAENLCFFGQRTAKYSEILKILNPAVPSVPTEQVQVKCLLCTRLTADRILFLSRGESHVVVSRLFYDVLDHLWIDRLPCLEHRVVLAPGRFDFFCIWKSLPEFICNVGLAHAAHHSIYFYFVLIHLLIPLFCAWSGALRYLPYKTGMDKAAAERSAAAICYFVFSVVPQPCPHAPQLPLQFLQELPFLKL